MQDWDGKGLIQNLIAMRRCLTVLVVLVVLASLSVNAARADDGLAAGTSAVNVAGQPVLVRATPGWDAAVSYELAAGAGVTVWDVAQPAADGSLWYAIDGGFVPAESLAATTAPTAPEQPVQDVSVAQTVDPAAPEAAATEWVEAAPVDASGVAAPAETWVDPSLATEAAAPDPALSAWISTTGTGGLATDQGASAPIDAAPEWTDPTLESAVAEPVTAEWIDPTAAMAPAAPASGEWVEPAVGESAPAAPNEWVEPSAATALDTVLSGGAAPIEVAQEVIAVDEAAPHQNFV